MSLHICSGCGITNKPEYFRCVACDQRLDRPFSFKDKNDVYTYFSRGGFTEIAEELKKGYVPWDPRDAHYTYILEKSVLLALEESFATLDVLFYSDYPSTGGPYMGIRWPKSSVLDAIQISFLYPDGDHRFTILERSKTADRGVEYRFDTSLGKEGIKFEIRLSAVYGKSSGPNKKFECHPIILQPEDPSDSHSSYILKRPNTGIKVN